MPQQLHYLSAYANHFDLVYGKNLTICILQVCRFQINSARRFLNFLFIWFVDVLHLVFLFRSLHWSGTLSIMFCPLLYRDVQGRLLLSPSYLYYYIKITPMSSTPIANKIILVHFKVMKQLWSKLWLCVLPSLTALKTSKSTPTFAAWITKQRRFDTILTSSILSVLVSVYYFLMEGEIWNAKQV